MKILYIPYFAGGLSHLIPLYVLHHQYLRKNESIKKLFLVNNHLQGFLRTRGVSCVDMDYLSENEPLMFSNNYVKIIKHVVKKQKEAYDMVKPEVIIEDNSTSSPLIAEKNNVPRISIQRTGVFRSIEERFRNKNHVHSTQKGSLTEGSAFFTISNNKEGAIFNDSESYFLKRYENPKAKIIPGIPTIERLPDDIQDRASYFYSGPLIVKDKPSRNLSARLDDFLMSNEQKPVVFITTGTVDKTPIERFIEFFVKRNYAVITTCDCQINETYKQEIFYKEILPLNYICKISNLVIHQCGSGIYHYPIMNRVPFLTIGTQCYDREDIAQRLQNLGVSGHIPHPEDHPDYWNIFLEMVHKFEENKLVDNDMMDQLQTEIDETTSNFQMEEVIQYALA